MGSKDASNAGQDTHQAAYTKSSVEHGSVKLPSLPCLPLGMYHLVVLSPLFPRRSTPCFALLLLAICDSSEFGLRPRAQQTIPPQSNQTAVAAHTKLASIYPSAPSFRAQLCRVFRNGVFTEKLGREHTHTGNYGMVHPADLLQQDIRELARGHKYKTHDNLISRKHIPRRHAWIVWCCL